MSAGGPSAPRCDFAVASYSDGQSAAKTVVSDSARMIVTSLAVSFIDGLRFRYGVRSLVNDSEPNFHAPSCCTHP